MVLGRLVLFGGGGFRLLSDGLLVDSTLTRCEYKDCSKEQAPGEVALKGS